MGNKNGQIRCFRLVTVLANLFLLLSSMCSLAQQDSEQINVPIHWSKSFRIPENLTLRVRFKKITTKEPTPIQWRHGGEGQGGEVIHGVFPKVGVPADAPAESHTLRVG
jgi:hypothetical protein